LARDGWARLTTNRIAERAGVNISSLYQYFPSKEAIVHELQRRQMAAVHADAEAMMPPASIPLAELIHLGVRQVFDAVAVNPELYRSFLEEIPRSMRRLEPMDARLVESFTRRVTRGMVGVPEPELAFILWGAVMDGIVRAVCGDAPHLLAHPKLADEVSLLLCRYLIREAPAPKPRPLRRRSPRPRAIGGRR